MDATAGASSDPLCGREIAGGRYFVVDVLGRGGMGTVYTALQRPIDRKVALKLIHRELASNPDVVGRFMQEMRLTATIEHPHTVRLYDFGDIDGQPFLTTEFLDGRTLRAELERSGPFPQVRLCNVGIQIAKALRAAHEHGVVHRDLKPDNIMLTGRYGERDYVKVLDFGIARSLAQATDFRTGTGALLGTPAYMSPEQCEGRAVDGRSDLYALGLVLYELATGALPFPPSDSIPQLLIAHVSTPAPDVRTRTPGLAEPLAALIMALLEKKPDARPATAAAVIAALEPFVGMSTSPGLPASTMAIAPAVVAGGTMVLPGATPAAPVAGRRSRKPLVAASAGIVAIAVAFLVLRGRETVTAEAVAAALTGAGEPPFPPSCVTPDHRAEVMAAARGSGPWSAVPADHPARRLAEARAPGLSDADVRALVEPVVAACPRSAVARTLLGKALARLGQDEGAVGHLRTAVELAPRYVPARFNLAVAHVKRGEAAEAAPLLDGVLADEPTHAGARLLRGQLRLSSGDAAGAAEDLRAHTAAQPEAGPAWAMLGEALTKTGAAADARAAFCRAAALGVERARSRCPAP